MNDSHSQPIIHYERNDVGAVVPFVLTVLAAKMRKVQLAEINLNVLPELVDFAFLSAAGTPESRNMKALQDGHKPFTVCGSVNLTAHRTDVNCRHMNWAKKIP